MGIVGRKKIIEAKVYNAFYGDQWMKNYPSSIQIPVFMFWYIVGCLQSRHGLLNFHYNPSRVMWFVTHGVKYKNYNEHMVLETSSLATLWIQIG